MKVLSLFDGMACGMLALQKLNISISKYVAYEIDKYAIKTATYNFPMIEQRGDVFKADFTEFKGFDYLIGGSPCTYWSIAQKNNRETEASGLGWELFSQYVRALREAQPKYFIYENNKSMSQAIRDSITNTFGFEPICINSALVSAQNRKRLYWVGIKQPDGTYKKADITQPEDRGIMLKDILENSKPANIMQPVCVAERGRYNADGIVEQHFEAREDGKTNVLTTVQKDNNVAEPINLDRIFDLKSNEDYIQYDLSGKNHNSQDQRAFYSNSKHGTLNASSTESKTGIIEAIPTGEGKSVYTVKDGQITIKGKQYPIKLADGFYIIRKLSVTECMRLQTVPEWFVFPVSNAQAYKMLGNGWTVDVISHILSCISQE